MNPRKTQTIMIAAALSASGLGAFLMSSEPGEQPLGDSMVVALVNSDPIVYSAIEVTAEDAKDHFALQEGRRPTTEADLDAVEKLRRGEELQRLAKVIRLRIRAQTISRLGIEITEAEVRERWEELRKERDPPDTIAARRAKMRALVDALDAVYENSEDANEVYTAHLRDYFTPGEWKAALRQYRTLQIRKGLKELLTKQELDLEDVETAVRSVVLAEKVARAVDEELIRTDPEFSEYVRLLETDPKNEKVRSKGPMYRNAKRYHWWQQQYRGAKIEILDQRFRGAWKQPVD